MLQDAAWQKFYEGEMYEKLGDVNSKLAEQKNISAAERLKYLQAARLDYQKAVEFGANPNAGKRISPPNQKDSSLCAKKLAIANLKLID
jgi:hypothetical protein